MRKIGVFCLLFLFSFSVVPSPKFEASSFPDVKSYKDEINYLAERKIIGGYSDGTFGPEKALSRLNAIQILLKAKGITDFTAPNPNLTDMAPGNYGYPEVAKAVQLGIISGKTAKNGTKYFDSGNQLTRGQMAKVLVEADKLKIRNTTIFLDVPTSNGFHDYISTLAAERITGGYADGTYQPSKSISRAHFAVFVARMLNDDFKPDQINTAPRYILDKTKTYVVEESWLGNGISSNATYLRSNIKGHAGWDLWKVVTTNEAPVFMLLKEDSTGSYTKFCDSEAGIDCEDRIYTDLKYPLTVGKSWKESNNNWAETLTIVSLNRTVSIKAGIFNNVVEVKSSDGFIRYFAPNVGIIKVDYNGNQYSAMSKIK